MGPGPRARLRSEASSDPTATDFPERAPVPFLTAGRALVECDSVRVAVPKETGAGERRVALVPDAVGRLAAAGFTFAVERGAGVGRGVHRRRRTRRPARTSSRAPSCSPAPGASSASGRPTADEVDELAPGHGADRLPRAAERSGRDRTARRARRRRVRDGVDPAHHARAVDGRALVAEHRRRLQGGAGRRRAAAEVLPDADDRRRHGRTGEGARPRRRRRRAAGDRDRAPPRRGRLGASTSGRPSGSRWRASAPTFLDLGVTGEETEGGYARELTPRSRRASRRRSRSGFPSSTP